jgi:hypothetical protein
MHSKVIIPPSASLLAEVVCDDPHRRFLACTATSTTIMGYGLNACRTHAERVAWMAQYAQWLLDTAHEIERSTR